MLAFHWSRVQRGAWPKASHVISPWFPRYHPHFHNITLIFHNITLIFHNITLIFHNIILVENEVDISEIPTRILARWYNAEGIGTTKRGGNKSLYQSSTGCPRSKGTFDSLFVQRSFINAKCDTCTEKKELNCCMNIYIHFRKLQKFNFT